MQLPGRRSTFTEPDKFVGSSIPRPFHERVPHLPRSLCLYNTPLTPLNFHHSYSQPYYKQSIYYLSIYQILPSSFSRTYSALYVQLLRSTLMAQHLVLDNALDFEDYFPSMIERLGAEAFIAEICNGFRLLMDCEKGLITFESLKRNSFLLGLHDMGDEELVCMLLEGDLDGDGALSQMEFCILMFRLSPGLMDGSKRWMDDFDVADQM